MQTLKDLLVTVGFVFPSSDHVIVLGKSEKNNMCIYINIKSSRAQLARSERSPVRPSVTSTSVSSFL